MKGFRVPAFIFCLFYLGFFAFVAFSFKQLPEEMATHFDASGQPIGWMRPTTCALFFLIIAFAFPLLMFGFGLIALLLPKPFNFPGRDYWFSKEHRAKTYNYFIRHLLWFSCMSVCFLAAVYYLLVRANVESPVHLSNTRIFGLLGCFLVGVVIWVRTMIRYFGHAN